MAHLILMAVLLAGMHRSPVASTYPFSLALQIAHWFMVLCMVLWLVCCVNWRKVWYGRDDE